MLKLSRNSIRKKKTNLGNKINFSGQYTLYAGVRCTLKGCRSCRELLYVKHYACRRKAGARMTDLFVQKCQQTAGDPHQAELICRRCTARAACGCNYSLTKIHHRLKHVSFDVWERCGGDTQPCLGATYVRYRKLRQPRSEHRRYLFFPLPTSLICFFFFS